MGTPKSKNDHEYEYENLFIHGLCYKKVPRTIAYVSENGVSLTAVSAQNELVKRHFHFFDLGDFFGVFF